MKTLNSANEARKEKAINKLYNFSDHGVTNFKNLIDKGVFIKGEPELVPELKFNRRKFNYGFGYDQKAQDEYYRRCTEKTKQTYFLYYDETTSTEVSKFVYEYYMEKSEKISEYPEATEEELKHLFGLK